MKAHIKALGSLHIILAIVYFSFGLMGLFIFGGWPSITGGEPNPAFMIPLLGPIGGWISAAAAAYSVPELIVSIAFLLHKPWSRPLMMALSALSLPLIPINTLLGFYGFYVAGERETKELFDFNRPSAGPA